MLLSEFDNEKTIFSGKIGKIQIVSLILPPFKKEWPSLTWHGVKENKEDFPILSF